MEMGVSFGKRKLFFPVCTLVEAVCVLSLRAVSRHPRPSPITVQHLHDTALNFELGFLSFRMASGRVSLHGSVLPN